MTNVDQFESTFRAAAKEVFEFRPVSIDRVLVITDLDADEAEALTTRIRRFLRTIDPGDDGWTVLHGDTTHDVERLLEIVNESSADLVCTYRHLHGDGWRYPYTLGDHLEVLTQKTAIPVLVVPHPAAGRASDHALEDASAVMAITDHLTGDSRLVNVAARFTEPGGTLYLAHVEDEHVFERYIDIIGKIPALETDVARETMRERLLKEPHDFVASCRAGLEAAGIDLHVNEIISLGHRLRTYVELVESHTVSLLVLNTKDEDQHAMHGLAYPLAVELRQIPLLML